MWTRSGRRLLATSGAGSAGGGGADVVVTDQERLGFSQFLSNIGTAMLDTQRELDSQSLAYLQENSQNRHVLPSIFRLPKLSAEMKFALEKQDERTVNLVFFKNQTMAKEMHQQSSSSIWFPPRRRRMPSLRFRRRFPTSRWYCAPPSASRYWMPASPPKGTTRFPPMRTRTAW